MTYEIPPQSSNCLKRLARQLKSDDVGHMRALEITSQKSGYPGWKKAEQLLPDAPFKITIEATYEREKGAKGKVILTLPFKKPILELFYGTPKQGDLNWFTYSKARDRFKLIFPATSIGSAREYVTEAFRRLYFMQETGLIPSYMIKAKNETARQMPYSTYSDKSQAPYFDHASFWRNPKSKHLVILNEPYTHFVINYKGETTKTDYGKEVDDWMSRLGFKGESIQHRGLYTATCTFIMIHESSDYDLQSLISAFDGVPECLLASEWEYLEDNFITPP